MIGYLAKHQGLYPVVPCRTAARSSAARIALRHCPMLRFAFSAAGGAQLCIPRTRPGGSRIQARPSAKQKAALSDGFFFWWGIRDFTRLCRVALLRGLPPLALLCGTAQCSASLSPPQAALSSAYPEPAPAGPGFKPALAQNKKPPCRTAFLFW